MDKKRGANIYQEANAVRRMNYFDNFLHNWTTLLHHMDKTRITTEIKNK
jgi:hypothetical protein